MYRLFNEDFTKVDPNSNNNGKRTMFAKNFNSDISKWDVSKVTSMVQTFSRAVEFNGDLSRWVTSKVTNFLGMFYGCSAFVADLSKWNTSQVTNMASMFFVASSPPYSKFNADLSKW